MVQNSGRRWPNLARCCKTWVRGVQNFFSKDPDLDSSSSEESSQIRIREIQKVRFLVHLYIFCVFKLIYFCLFHSALKYKYSFFGLSYLPTLCSCVSGAAVLSHAGQLPRQQLSRASWSGPCRGIASASHQIQVSASWRHSLELHD